MDIKKLEDILREMDAGEIKYFMWVKNLKGEERDLALAYLLERKKEVNEKWKGMLDEK